MMRTATVPNVPCRRPYAILVSVAVVVASASTMLGQGADPGAPPVRGCGLCDNRDDRYEHPGPRSKYTNRAIFPLGYSAGCAGTRCVEGAERSVPRCSASAAGHSASRSSTSTGTMEVAHNFLTNNYFDIAQVWNTSGGLAVG